MINSGQDPRPRLLWFDDLVILPKMISGMDVVGLFLVIVVQITHISESGRVVSIVFLVQITHISYIRITSRSWASIFQLGPSKITTSWFEQNSSALYQLQLADEWHFYVKSHILVILNTHLCRSTPQSWCLNPLVLIRKNLKLSMVKNPPCVWKKQIWLLHLLHPNRVLFHHVKSPCVMLQILTKSTVKSEVPRCWRHRPSHSPGTKHRPWVQLAGE